MTTNSFNNFKQDLLLLISSLQESLRDQIERISRGELTDLDGNRYKEGTHDTLDKLFTQYKQDLITSSMRKVRRKIVFRSTLNYLSKAILFKYLNDCNVESDCLFELPKTDFDFLDPSLKAITDINKVLATYSFKKLNVNQIGMLYQELLSLSQQQQTLGAFYTPKDTVDYMVSKLNLSTNTTVFDPACGNGHFLESCITEIKKKLINVGYTDAEATQKAISQVWGNDIDPFAVLLSTIRIFFLGVEDELLRKSYVFNFDALELKNCPPFPDKKQFDYIIGNPPYGRNPSKERKELYKKIYRVQSSVYGYRLSGNDLYGFFLANAIKRVKNGGTICFIISDTFLSLKSHTILRRLILDTCKINEILLAPIDLFRPMTTSRTCIITLTKQLCEKGYSHPSIKTRQQNKRHCRCVPCSDRRKNRIRLVDRIQNQSEYFNPQENDVQFIEQEAYEYISGTPFWVNVPSKFIQTMRLTSLTKPDNIKDGWKYEELRNYIDGGEGISTGDNYSHLVIIQGSSLWKSLQGSQKIEKYRIYDADKIIDLTSIDEQTLDHYRHNGIDGEQFLVSFERGSYFPYWGTEGWYIDWSPHSVEQIKRRAQESKGRRAVFRNPHLYFKKGITTNAHHGIIKATLAEYSIVAGNSNLLFGTRLDTKFILGYLNSKLASFFLGKIINTSLGGMSGHVTPENIKQLPILLPLNKKMAKTFQDLKNGVIQTINEIILLLKDNLEADYSEQQQKIDDHIFEWFDLSKTERKVVDDYLNRVSKEKALY